VPKIVARDNEPFQVTLRRFKKACEKSALLSDVKKNRFFEKPSVIKRRALNAAKRKVLKQTRKNNRFKKSF
jgi:small subunit ribosomal protein S21